MLRSNRVAPTDSKEHVSSESPNKTVVHGEIVPKKSASTVLESTNSSSSSLLIPPGVPRKSILKVTSANNASSNNLVTYSSPRRKALSTINLVNITLFSSQAQIPRYPDQKYITINLDYVERDDSFIVFVSHNWLRGHADCVGWDGRPHPDNATADKFHLCVEGIHKLWKNIAPGMTNCYLWIDFSCLDQNIKPIKSNTPLESIMKIADCVFTPIFDPTENDWSYPTAGFTDPTQEYLAPSWMDITHGGYTHRAWCRIEMFFSTNIPLETCSPSRLQKFSADFQPIVTAGLRPHYLYGTKEKNADWNPLCLPPLPNSRLTELDPTMGGVNKPEDLSLIASLLTDLLPYMTPNTIGYTGQRDVEGRMHGKGVFRAGNGDVYCGDFVANTAHGSGVYKFSNGAVYEGEFQHDKQHGKGVYRFANGSVYEGEFKDDMLDGYGVYRFANGDMYEGDYRLDLKHGQGKYSYTSGNFYQGGWVEGRKSGRGMLTYANGAVYEGDFQDDRSHGKGTLTFADSRVYEGDFRNGVRDGQGILKYPNGNVFWGEYRNDKPHGRGVMRYADGRLDENLWEDGVKIAK